MPASGFSVHLDQDDLAKQDLAAALLRRPVVAPSTDRSDQAADDRSNQAATDRPSQAAGDCSSQAAGDRPSQAAGDRPSQAAGDRPNQVATDRPSQVAGDRLDRPAAGHHGARDQRQAARGRSERDHARTAGTGKSRSYAFRRS